MLGISAAGSSGAAVLAAFLGRGVETRRARGVLTVSGFVEISGEDVVSSLMLLGRSKPAGVAGVENIQTFELSKIPGKNTARHAYPHGISSDCE